ncbi:MAG: transglycosylase [Rhodobacterales bacterium]|nr:MAG: transglycosylase [Rhodobacterales bacterium]
MRMVLLALFSLFAAPLSAEPDIPCTTTKWGHRECIRPEHFVFDTCQMIDVISARHGLDRNFFARLIWQESRFDPYAISPAGAMGIAQFIASTAARRGLRDPFNPADALEHSAEYLADMVRRFGNVGLAAVGYNGGEHRVEQLFRGEDRLRRETVDYVQIITGMGHSDWVDGGKGAPDLRLSKTLPFREACYQLARQRRLSPLPRPEPKIKPWGVQLAFGTSPKHARSRFETRTRSCRRIVKGETVDLIWQKSRASASRGYYMARIGRNTRDAAWKFCSRLKANGCICAVYRNRN